jgi:hypothetical protein
MIAVTSLRKIFTEQGIKGSSKWKREDFDSRIIADWFAAQAEQASKELAEMAAKPAKPAKGKKVCRVCNLRSIGTGKGIENDKDHAKALKICIPCLEEAGWENRHSDDDHDDPEASHSLDLANDLDACWTCHPELNMASPEYVAPRGTSRAGMVMTVPVRAAGISKAEVTASKFAAIGTKSKITVENERTYLSALVKDGAITLVWDQRGRYDYNASSITVNGKTNKIRNVSEAHRLVRAGNGK